MRQLTKYKKMLNNMSLNEKNFSFKKNYLNSMDLKTKEFKNETPEKIAERGRKAKIKNENNTGAILLTFGIDKENSINIFKKIKIYFSFSGI